LPTELICNNSLMCKAIFNSVDFDADHPKRMLKVYPYHENHDETIDIVRLTFAPFDRGTGELTDKVHAEQLLDAKQKNELLSGKVYLTYFDRLVMDALGTIFLQHGNAIDGFRFSLSSLLEIMSGKLSIQLSSANKMIKKDALLQSLYKLCNVHVTILLKRNRSDQISRSDFLRPNLEGPLLSLEQKSSRTFSIASKPILIDYLGRLRKDKKRKTNEQLIHIPFEALGYYHNGSKPSVPVMGKRTESTLEMMMLKHFLYLRVSVIYRKRSEYMKKISLMRYERHSNLLTGVVGTLYPTPEIESWGNRKKQRIKAIEQKMCKILDYYTQNGLIKKYRVEDHIFTVTPNNVPALTSDPDTPAITAAKDCRWIAARRFGEAVISGQAVDTDRKTEYNAASEQQEENAAAREETVAADESVAEKKDLIAEPVEQPITEMPAEPGATAQDSENHAAETFYQRDPESASETIRDAIETASPVGFENPNQLLKDISALIQSSCGLQALASVLSILKDATGKYDNQLAALKTTFKETLDRRRQDGDEICQYLSNLLSGWYEGGSEEALQIAYADLTSYKDEGYDFDCGNILIPVKQCCLRLLSSESEDSA